jgi:hypothetical protein
MAFRAPLIRQNRRCRAIGGNNFSENGVILYNRADCEDHMVNVGLNMDVDITALSIAVIIPCYNEGASILTVVADFKRSVPSAAIYVYDNNSQDDTAAEARTAGAIVRSETRQGKGYVVRRMFADIEADVYVMVDGDDTYDATAADGMINKLVRENLDMVSGARAELVSSAYRPGHKFGNRFLTGLVQIMFGNEFTDMLSGYRIFSRRFVKSFPQSSGGFEIETELTVHALELQMPTAEVRVAFKDRAEGSESKLNTFSDGFRIIWTIANLLRLERPISTFGMVGSLLLTLAVVLMYPIFVTFIETGLVPRFPTAIIATGITLLAFLSFTAGLILDAVTRGRQESKRMRYLEIPSTLAILSQSKIGKE